MLSKSSKTPFYSTEDPLHRSTTATWDVFDDRRSLEYKDGCRHNYDLYPGLGVSDFGLGSPPFTKLKALDRGPKQHPFGEVRSRSCEILAIASELSSGAGSASDQHGKQYLVVEALKTYTCSLRPLNLPCCMLAPAGRKTKLVG